MRIGWLVVLSGAVFLTGLGRRDIVTSHEARVAQPARQMAAAGWPWSAELMAVAPVQLVNRAGLVRLQPDPDEAPLFVNPWVVPVLNGEIRLQKPPLPYWCAAAIFRLTGGFSEAGARFIPALLGVLATLLLYDLALQLFGRRCAWYSSLAWVSSYLIPDEYRLAMADPYLAFFSLACVWSWVTAADSRRARAGLATPLFYVSLALGLLAKGPPLLVDVALPLAAYHWCFRKPLPRRWGGHVLGMVLLFAIALPWPLGVLRQIPNAAELWRYESVGELADNVENARPWAFYLLNLPLLALPWIGPGGIGVALPLLAGERSPRRRRRLFPLLWFGATVVFFSFVHLKKNPYLLPAMPAQALIVGQGLTALVAWGRRSRGGVVAMVMLAQAFLGVGFGLATLGLLAHDHALGSGGLLLCVSGTGLALLALRDVIQWRPGRWVATQSIAYAVLIMAFASLYTAAKDNRRSARGVCHELQGILKDPNLTLLVSKVPEEAAVYLPLDLRYGIARHVLVLQDDGAGSQRRKSRHQPEPQPSTEEFNGWITDGKIVEVKRFPLASAPGDARWKLFDLTVDRRQVVQD